jgi:hypothetical protein
MGCRFRDVRDESGLPSTPERLRQRGETTLRPKAVLDGWAFVFVK